MKYLDYRTLLLLIISLHSTAANSSCSFDDKITPRIKAIGRPYGSIKVTWDSVNSSGKPVLYQVYYNRTSMWNHCEYPTTDAFYTAKHCGQKSTKEGILHECELTKEYKMLKLDMGTDSLCIMISITSTWLNKTCYVFLENNSYLDEPICPAPENLQVRAHKAGKLAVHWTVSPNFVGKTALQEMSFIIHYEYVGKSTMCTAKETKTLSALANYNFSHKNNTYVIKDLGPCCLYMVTICCVFRTIKATCHSGYTSNPFYVTTAEQEPTRAPQVERYFVQHENLLVKWKIPSNYACTDKITLYEIHYWEKQDDNCSNISNSTVIKKYITTRSSDREANLTGLLPVAHCFCIRMCNNQTGCGPWSMVYSVDYTSPITARKSTSNTDPSSVKIVVYTSSGILVALLILAVFLVIFRRRNTSGRQRTLEEEVGDLEPATELLDSSQSTTEMESLNDYATAY